MELKVKVGDEIITIEDSVMLDMDHGTSSMRSLLTGINILEPIVDGYILEKI